MRPFDYERATSVPEAVATVAADPEATFLAGGTNLVDLMKLGVATPSRVLDVTRVLPREIEPTPDGGLFVGAGARNSELAGDRQVRRAYPVLARALLAGASGQLRNAATVGGNLVQRTRCGYFTDVSKPCNKRLPGSGCPAREGRHRDLAILGGSAACVATNPSDMAVAMVALNAVVHLEGVAGARSMPIRELFRLPGAEPHRDTTLTHGELITGVTLPPLPAAARSTYRKVRDRASYAFALVSVAAVVEPADGSPADVRLALGGVAPMPWRATVAESRLRGRPYAELTDDAVAAAAHAELAAADPLRDNAFKVGLAEHLITTSVLGLLPGNAGTDLGEETV